MKQDGYLQLVIDIFRWFFWIPLQFYMILETETQGSFNSQFTSSFHWGTILFNKLV